MSHLQDVPRVNPAFFTSSLPLPPIPTFPDPRLNFVVWPVTGLSHYAIGHVLVDNAVGATTATGVTLSLTDDAADAARTLSMTVLNRRPLVDTRTTLVDSPGAAVANPFDGWILTLVDSRYLRRKVIASGDTIPLSTWGELIHELGDAAGFTMESASTIQALVHADFGTPDLDDWAAANLAGEGYSVAADAAAAAVGLRLVVATDGTVTAQVAATSDTVYATWLTATGRDNFATGGITEDRYSAPRYVQCDGVDVVMPSPTTRMDDRDHATLVSTSSAFRTKWVAVYSDWLAATFVTADLRGFIYPPVCGVVQHVEYGLDTCSTRVVKHPSRYPLPLMARDKPPATGAGGGGAAPPCFDVVTKICQDGYGTLTVEYKTICLPRGSTVSEAFCEPPGTDCCDSEAGAGACTDSETPRYRTATVSNETGDCTCMPATLTYNGDPPVGTGTYPFHSAWNTSTCPGNVSWDLICRGNVWELWVGGSYDDPTAAGVQATAVSSGVGILVFDSPDLGANCGGSGGTVRITITA